MQIILSNVAKICYNKYKAIEKMEPKRALKLNSLTWPKTINMGTKNNHPPIPPLFQFIFKNVGEGDFGSTRHFEGNFQVCRWKNR